MIIILSIVAFVQALFGCVCFVATKDSVDRSTQIAGGVMGGVFMTTAVVLLTIVTRHFFGVPIL